MSSVIVDFHTHIFPPWLRERRDEYVKSDPCFALLYSQPKAKIATAEELVASMDEAGIDLSVVLNAGWVSHELCVRTNDYILDSISRYPKRLVGFCAIQPSAGEAAIAEIERCAKAGAKGIGELRSDVQGFDLADKTTMGPVVDAVLKHDLILLTHSSEPVGHEYFGKGRITTDILYSFITAFPNLKVVCAHWGGGLPFYALMPEVAKALANVFFDSAATVFLYKPEIFEQVSRIIGSDKILFGTDYPLMHQNRVIAQVQSAQLPAQDKAKILGTNARRLLYWDKGAKQ
ncbi:MAG: amidohydrolase family protein [Dehalococcoidia bacterium]|nr:amidohydrolase family protein [Dehalococcoidia bacterium]